MGIDQPLPLLALAQHQGQAEHAQFRGHLPRPFWIEAGVEQEPAVLLPIFSRHIDLVGMDVLPVGHQLPLAPETSQRRIVMHLVHRGHHRLEIVALHTPGFSVQPRNSRTTRGCVSHMPKRTVPP